MAANQEQLNNALLDATDRSPVDPARVEALLANGADVACRSGLGYTPLINAARTDKSGVVVQRLVGADSPLNVQSKYGDTALILASANNNAEGVRVLVAAGADTSLRNNRGDTAEDIARRRGYTDIVALLQAPAPAARTGAAPVRAPAPAARAAPAAAPAARAAAVPGRSGPAPAAGPDPYGAELADARAEAARLREQLATLAAQRAPGTVIPLSDLTIGEPISRDARGSFKVARHGQYLSHDVCVLELSGVDPQARWQEEDAILTSIGNHPYLVRYYGRAHAATGNSVFMVVELMPEGSLESLIQALSDDGDALSPLHALAVCYQVAEGMRAVAGRGVKHCDLAIRNVLVRRFQRATAGCISIAISDFGLAREDRGGRTAVYTNRPGSEGAVVPVRWAAPEVLERGRWSEKSDVWAFGVLMWEVWSGGKLPYGLHRSDDQIIDIVCESGERLAQPRGCPDVVYGLMQRCWAPLAKDRPTFAEVCGLLHAIVAGPPFNAPLAALAGSGLATAAAAAAAEEPEEDVTCCVCMEEPPQSILAPCGHRCCCGTCAERLRVGAGLCPMCRAAIESIVSRVY